MEFQISVLGDVRLFADTLNGIAMMFSVAGGEHYNLWASNTNSMGLGMGAFLGVLLSICLLVYNAAFRQRFDIRAVIIPLLLYIILTVPKVRVNVIDAYGMDGMQTVDNVPLGLAFPMSAISGIALSATETLETIFRVPNPSFTKITEDGFVMPLKLLNAMRYTGLTMRDAYPNITESLAEVVKICMTNNEGFDPRRYQNSGDSMGVFYAALAHPSVASRLVKVYPASAPQGKITNCEFSGEWFRNSMEAYLSGTVMTPELTLMSQDAIKVKNFKRDIQKILASNNGTTGSNMLTQSTLSTARIMDDIQALTDASNDDVLNFAAATLFNPQLSAATECVESSNNAATARCFAYNTTQEQWKERSAAEATGFLSIMRDGQNLLILLSVTLFPIMVLIVVLQGLGGLKVVMSYLLYTISAYMWIPVAAMINWYVQVQLNDELEKWRVNAAGLDVGEVYLSLANAPLFYDAVSKKLALANSVMASVPMICMGLFSGMLMTMNRLADKMNPQAGYDASANIPKAISRDSLAKVGSGVSFDGASSVGKQSGLAEMSTIQSARQLSDTKAKMQTDSKQLSESLSKMAANDIYMGRDTQKQIEYSKAWAKQLGFNEQQTNSLSDTKSALFNTMKGFALTQGLSTGAVKNSTETQEAIKQAAISAGVSLDGIKGNAGATAAFTNKLGSALQQSVGSDTNFARLSQETGTDINGRTASHMSAETASKLYTATTSSAFKDVVSDSSGYKNSLTSSQTFQEAKSRIDQSNRTQGELTQFASTFSAPLSTLANMNNKSDGQMYNNLVAVTDSWKDEGFNKRVEELKESGRLTVNRGDEQALDLQARYTAAQEQSVDRRAEVNFATLGNLVSTPQQNLSGYDATDTAARAAENTKGVEAAVRPSNGLTREQVDSKYKATEGKAEQNKDDVNKGVSQTPTTTLNQVASAATVADKNADKVQAKVYKDVAGEVAENFLSQQPDNGNYNLTAADPKNQTAVNAYIQGQEQVKVAQQLENEALNKDNGIADRIFSALALGEVNKAAMVTQVVAGEGAAKIPLNKIEVDPKNPALTVSSDSGKTVGEAYKGGYEIKGSNNSVLHANKNAKNTQDMFNQTNLGETMKNSINNSGLTNQAINKIGK